MGIQEDCSNSLPTLNDMGNSAEVAIANDSDMECEEPCIQHEVSINTPPDLACPLSSQLSQVSVQCSELDRKVAAAKVILQLREGHQISQVAIAEIIQSCRSLCKQAVDEVKSEIVEALRKSGPGSESECLSTVLEKQYDPFENIDTNYLFEKFCVEHLGCNVSNSIAIII